jgi:hypothetical protein
LGGCWLYQRGERKKCVKGKASGDVFHDQSSVVAADEKLSPFGF